jgi:hypothetical protein
MHLGQHLMSAVEKEEKNPKIPMGSQRESQYRLGKVSVLDSALTSSSHIWYDDGLSPSHVMPLPW